MKKYTTFFISALFSSLMIAQSPTTITNASFFNAGDVLRTSADVLPNIDLGNAGPNNNWDFTSLNTTIIDETEIFPATEGVGYMNYPSADVFINVPGGELYLKINEGNIKQVGFVGTLMGMMVNNPFNPQGDYQVAPINYGDNFSTSNGLAFAVDAESVPFLENLDLPITPDSIRITQLLNADYEADAWGMMSVPIGDYEVLRLKKTETTSTQIEAYVNIIGWLDVTDIVVGALPEFGEIVVESYEFLADGVKEPIAVVELEPLTGNVTTVTFKAEDNGMTSVAIAGHDLTILSAYPNPAYDDVRIDVRGVPNGQYDLSLFNITGKEMLLEHIDVNKDTAVIINVSHLPKGTYLYVLKNDKSGILKAKRLTVIKP